MKKIYFDVCCLNRPFDDQTNSRIRLETEAIHLILDLIEKRKLELLDSEVIKIELDNTPNFERMISVKEILINAKIFIKIEEDIQKRANDLVKIGLKGMDALHLACAESIKETVLLTVDDKFCKIAMKNYKLINVKVENPTKWIDEVI